MGSGAATGARAGSGTAGDGAEAACARADAGAGSGSARRAGAGATAESSGAAAGFGGGGGGGTVRDNGEGIPHDIQEKIFDPFFTARAAGSGMGLGLSIVDRIVRGFNGYIRVDSTPNEGTSFTVFLPAHQGDGIAT